MHGKSKVNTSNILLHPVGTEKAIRLLDQNKIVFIVDRRANKDEIKSAFESLFKVRIDKVNTEITTKSVKKAFIKLHADSSAVEVATTLGLL